MTVQDLLQNTYVILPMVVLVAWATLLILVDLFTGRQRKPLIILLAALGLVASLVVVLTQVGQEQVAFNGMVVLDGFAIFLQVVFLVSGLVAIALSYDYLKRMEIDRSEYYILLLYSISGMMLMSQASDLIVVFLALELLSIPLYVLAILSPNLTTTFFALLIPTGLGLAWLGPVLSAIQHVVPPTMRATASAIFLFINNLIGIGAGTVALGIISDNLEARFGDDSLRYAILSGTGFYLIAAILFLASAKRLAKDWEE
jgi:formate hydrogenlyase subunit 3/multisubunit Na+/H+ antiporter MnhD subunit